jgi:quercetin dioxygenase-like cupin family protein
MLIKGTALLWLDGQQMELSEGGIVFLPKDIPHAYRITSKKRICS